MTLTFQGELPTLSRHTTDKLYIALTRVYTQHNPDALSGREPAIEWLTIVWGTPSMTFTNITAWAGEGIGMLHYRMQAPEAGIHRAIMDRLKFEGTCFVEHWDVIQPIYGNETNPLAFF